MVRPTIATLHQQLNDNIKYSGERFDRLDTQLSLLNGSFRKSVTTIDRVKVIQTECPARNTFKKGRISYYLFNFITVMIAGAAIIVAIN